MSWNLRVPALPIGAGQTDGPQMPLSGEPGVLEWQEFLDAIASRTEAGWPAVRVPRGMPVRGEYLPKELEPTHVIRDAAGLPRLRLVETGDRLSLSLPEVDGALVNPKGPGLRALGFVATYARGAAYHLSAFRAADLRKGRPVRLHRESDNPHDPNAVALHAPGARKPFGYVQAARAVSVAKRLDSGEALGGISLRGQGRGGDDSAHLLIGSLADLVALLRD